MAKGGHRGNRNRANNQRSNSMNPNNAAYHASRNNHANQFNPNNSAYRARVNNRANQMNPNNPAYYSSRYSDAGYSEGGCFVNQQPAAIPPHPVVLTLQKSTIDNLNVIYRRVLQRSVDVDGAKYFGPLLAGGEISPRDVVRELAKSPEFFERYINAKPAQQVIKQLFRKFLSRNPENQLVIEEHIRIVNEKGWGHLIDMFINSEEYTSRFGNNEPR